MNLLWLLLGNAVQRAAFLDKVETVDGDDLATYELLGNDPKGAVVIFPLAEGGN